ncbi:Fumarate hydratase class I, aerobic (EC [Bathymodiolus thermophilus thioautotrophic gill symbiont]|jgi:fumarate hydratase class I|uniref:Fumarate hydratase class I n=3 Tax=sulfur-oxidizing symbionts TaxID=32036 RepID=A0A1H6J9M8_9GAMM|nr:MULTISPECIES: fumarate hydratase [sulfur-oxidizing symbionts]CAC9579953.1 Fumarate hydratase class I, aerobic (EC 4.2.1.2) [uncultured Gammaproteobacteria bacterium]CAB5495591.1 Fumarate hydratase class I, aerobic (EC [Bathymodiolus azoricus thioautotrophic gill symbiont]CAB5500490.1 Fumarate hydratase class I, aerobic (EC [Bathymodiolus thermophilus thioautotrophic gill symbiont]SEH57424.1 tartrate/fumarate subfamily Fe-S typehydro-lyase subunit alpha [Bathymodiolus azoricus thioautotrophic
MKIQQKHVIESVANALQYISYYHSPDFIQAMVNAYEKETNQSAKNAIAQILINSKMSAIGQRPMCQDTGIVNVFVEVGMDVVWAADLSLEDMINEGVRRAFTNENNPLRASIVEDPLFSRTNTKDNTPAVIHMKVVLGNKVDFIVAAKGCGSENKAKFAVLQPDDNVTDWVLKMIPTMGAGWCPPGVIGIGVGGTAEKAMLMAKASLMESIDIQDIAQKPNPSNLEKLRLELMEKINNLGIGAQGLGGLTTVLDVKIQDYPSHAASQAVAIIPNCAATRHLHFSMDGSGAATLPEVDMSVYPDLEMDYSKYKKVDLSTLTRQQMTQWNIGDTLLLTGILVTGRDAAHQRLKQMLDSGKGLPKGVDFNNKFIYYVGPVDAVGDEVIGPAGPTTATRMDKFTDMMLKETGILGMIGKAERGAAATQSIKKHQASYLIAVGGAAYLISKSIKKAKKIAFAEMGMEAIYEFEVKDMPVTVAVDTQGANIHVKNLG